MFFALPCKKAAVSWRGKKYIKHRIRQALMKIGYVSKFLPEKDGGAIYAQRLCDNMPCEVVRIGDINSTANYRLNFRSLLLGKQLAAIVAREKLDLLHVQYVPAGQYFGKYT